MNIDTKIILQNAAVKQGYGAKKTGKLFLEGVAKSSALLINLQSCELLLSTRRPIMLHSMSCRKLQPDRFDIDTSAGSLIIWQYCTALIYVELRL